jgi:hypothetical protein
MEDVDAIKATLQEIQFTNFSQYISDLLGAFKIPHSTIKRLLSSAVNDSFKSPIYVYRRATIVYDTTLKNKSDLGNIENKLFLVSRLLLVINKELVVCKDSVTEEVIEFKPCEIHNNIQFFFPLIYGKAFDRDFYTTRDFAELVGGLFNQLCMDEENNYRENPAQLTDFVLSLVYLSFGKSILQNKEFEKIINWALASQSNDYNSIMEGIFNAVFLGRKHGTLYGNLPHWNICGHTTNILPHINANSFDLSAKIIRYDFDDIDTEIFGSLIYKLVQDDDNQSIYGHQTSYQNVAKVLNPLFVNKYEGLIEQFKNNRKYLEQLREELLELIFFDPTNGPGCFLTASFNNTVNLVSHIDNLLGNSSPDKVKISHFIGLVDNDLSLKLSHLSLWVSYLQYLQRFYQVQESDLQAVYELITIRKGDQLLKTWAGVCPNNGHTLIIGSPTFKGAKKISRAEKGKMQQVFGTSKLGDTDFSSCWLYLAAKYIGSTTSQSSLVLTNSICQGAQVEFVWKRIYDCGCEISFAYRSFKWKNNAQQATGVSVVIIGLSSAQHENKIKYLYVDNIPIKTACIGPYLISSTKTIVKESNAPRSKQLPKMPKGNMPYDDQNLLLLKEEKNNLLLEYPSSSSFLKRIVGSDEFINKIERWCLWIPTDKLDEALSIPPIAERIEKVKQFRLSKSDLGARKLAERPHQFREFRSTTKDKQTLVIPSVSSENRPYIPIGFIGSDTIVSNLAFAIYDCEPWIFGLISSRMHMVWIRTVCGSLETRIRYSSRLGYNTFPFPEISTEKKEQIASIVFNIISEREKYCDLSLGDLYNDIPQGLRIFHENLDECIDHCYRDEPFDSDMERVGLLFKLYERTG